MQNAQGRCQPETCFVQVFFSTRTTEIIKIKIKKARSLQAPEMTPCLAPKRSPSEWDPLALFPYNSFCANDTARINSAIIKATGNGRTGQSFSQPEANTQWPEQTSCYLLPLLSRSCCCKRCCERNHRRRTHFVLLLELIYCSWWKILYREVSKTSPHLRCGVSAHTASSEQFRQKKNVTFWCHLLESVQWCCAGNARCLQNNNSGLRAE